MSQSSPTSNASASVLLVGIPPSLAGIDADEAAIALRRRPSREAGFDDDARSGRYNRFDRKNAALLAT